ncbi:MAG: RNA recognition motif domain-containing protein [Bradyrhizobium sp.]
MNGCEMCKMVETYPLYAGVLAAAAFIVGMFAGALLRKRGCKCGHGHAAGKYRAQQSAGCRPREERFEKRHPAPADGSIEIYVGNLSYDLTEEQLRKEFEAFGTVNSARIITNRFNNKSKGFGFVHMPVRAEADAAVQALNDKEILGRRLKCNEAKNIG